MTQYIVNLKWVYDKLFDIGWSDSEIKSYVLSFLYCQGNFDDLVKTVLIFIKKPYYYNKEK